MNLSKKGQYATKAMLKLAIKYNGSPVTLTEISHSQAISLSYLEQLFTMLRRAGLVQGVRGPGGGYQLRKSPNQISIADIILAIEDSNDIIGSKVHSNCKKGDDCITHSLWNEFSDQLSDYLASISLADVIKDHVVIKNQYQLDETTRQISTMFPVTAKLLVA